MNKLYLLIKRISDVVLSIIAIAFFIIPWIIISIIIKIKSPGPVIYKAKRVGLNGKIFTLYKFRSMNVDSGEISLTTLKGDQRVYPFGQFLRDSKLDETPQLLNVLFGQMSIIGPRPEDKINSDIYYVSEYSEILKVKPGLSSPASLYDYTHGENYSTVEKYENEFLPKKLDMELYYVRHRNIVYDVEVILRTIYTIVMIVFGCEKFKEPREVELCKRNQEYY